MAENILPSVLFVSCTAEDPVNLIKLVLEDLPKEKNDKEITMYDWHINTKYYEADIRLCTIKKKMLLTSEFASSVEGIIIFFDPSSPRGLDPVNEWMSFLEEYEAEVKIIVCARCQESPGLPLSKVKIQEWCVKEGFELVELQPLVDEEWENEQDFVETSGIARVIQALEAHVWPNLILKERRDPTTMAGLWHGGFCKSTMTDTDSLSTDLSNDTPFSPALERNEISSSIIQNADIQMTGNGFTTPTQRTQNNVSPSPEELFADESTAFCDLFSQLPMMRERANFLPSEHRKKFAEDVVLAYWKAIGGDKDEILDC